MNYRKKECIVLIDGEHYPPVIVEAIGLLENRYKCSVVGGVFLGGMEKIGRKEDLVGVLGIPLFLRGNILEGLKKALDEFDADFVFDLSDEPVVGYVERFQIASYLMSRNVHYKGSDFDFYPPTRSRVAKKPSIMIAGSGKRIGKTAVGAYIARVLSGQERGFPRKYDPCIVTMGRGGPAHPEMIEGHEIEMTPAYFMEQSKAGKHAASDHFEDAVMSRVRTIGCRRCGGGFSGEPFNSVVKEGAKLANSVGNDIIIFEGSGATNPPVHTDACIMVIGANQPEEYVSGYMGPFRVNMADLIVLTMCEAPMADPDKVERMLGSIRKISPGVPVLKTVFRPKPLSDVTDKKVVVCTTAPKKMGRVLSEHLEKNHKARVVGITHELSNRERLKEELEDIIKKKEPEVLVAEVKAASIDVATRIGIENFLEVVYMDNVPEVVASGENTLPDKMLDTADIAVRRYNGWDK